MTKAAKPVSVFSDASVNTFQHDILPFPAKLPVTSAPLSAWKEGSSFLGIQGTVDITKFDNSMVLTNSCDKRGVLAEFMVSPEEQDN